MSLQSSTREEELRRLDRAIEDIRLYSERIDHDDDVLEALENHYGGLKRLRKHERELAEKELEA